MNRSKRAFLSSILGAGLGLFLSITQVAMSDEVCRGKLEAVGEMDALRRYFALQSFPPSQPVRAQAVMSYLEAVGASQAQLLSTRTRDPMKAYATLTYDPFYRRYLSLLGEAGPHERIVTAFGEKYVVRVPHSEEATPWKRMNASEKTKLVALLRKRFTQANYDFQMWGRARTFIPLLRNLHKESLPRANGPIGILPNLVLDRATSSKKVPCMVCRNVNTSVAMLLVENGLPPEDIKWVKGYARKTPDENGKRKGHAWLSIKINGKWQDYDFTPGNTRRLNLRRKYPHDPGSGHFQFSRRVHSNAI